MDPNTRLMTMGAAGSGSSVVNFAGILSDSSFSVFKPVSTVDSENNFYIAFSDNRTPANRARVVKYSSLATLVWQVEIAQPNGYGVQIFDIVLDSNKDIILAVGLYTSFNFSYSSQLIKLNNSGSLLWSNGFSAPGSYRDSSFTGVTVDSSNNIYTVTQDYQRRGLYIFNSSGVLQSQSSITSSSGDAFYPLRIKCRGSDLYLYGQGAASSTGRGGFGVARFNTSGSFISAVSSEVSGSNLSPNSGDITVDSSGNAYVLGQASSNYPYVLKYNSSLGISWKRILYTNGTIPNSRFGIGVNGTGNNIYVSSHADTGNIRVIQNIDSSGSLVWERSISGGGNSMYAATISVANTGDIMAAQERYSNSISRYDIVSYLIPPDGSKTGTYLGTTYSSASYSISTASTSDYNLNLSLTPSSLSVSSFPINVSASSLTSSIVNLT
jgi:hypothetical protein